LKHNTALQKEKHVPAEGISSLEQWPVFACMTTGLDAGLRLIDVSIINHDGHVLVDTLVNPDIHIPASVAALSGIDDTAVNHAPRWQNIWTTVEDLLLAQNHVVAWSAEFDLRAMRGEFTRRDNLKWTMAIDSRFIDLSIAVSKFTGRECSFEDACALASDAVPGLGWQRALARGGALLRIIQALSRNR
jgi:DNA polymerase III epsilon subunit-like protein